MLNKVDGHVTYQETISKEVNDWPELNAEDVAKKAIKVAADICVFTNDNIRIEKI